jgi:hypothetical protein
MCNESTTGTDPEAPEPEWYGDVQPGHNRDGFLGAEEDLTAEWPGRGPDHVGSVP